MGNINDDRGLSELTKYVRDIIVELCVAATDEDLDGWLRGQERQYWIDAITTEQERRNPPVSLDIAGLIWTARDIA